uniref:DUF4806 domain-containing protein n=1 Tax=Stomoxys calcitrans TaxID=35570 RepID=A0A1I8Q3J0_STOCA
MSNKPGQSNPAKKIKYSHPQGNPSCSNCQDVAKKLDMVLEILAEHKVLLARLASQSIFVDEISIFPINSEEKLEEFDKSLETKTDPYMRQMKNLIESNPGRNLHKIFDREIIMNFNVDGTFGKKGLRDYGNVLAVILDVISTFSETPDKTLRDAFQRQKKKYFKQNSRNKGQNEEDDEER